jgi:hypothetical protein
MDAGLVKLLELLLLVGGLAAFAIWQLRSIDRDRRARLEREAAAGRAREGRAPDDKAGGDSD